VQVGVRIDGLGREDENRLRAVLRDERLVDPGSSHGVDRGRRDEKLRKAGRDDFRLVALVDSRRVEIENASGTLPIDARLEGRRVLGHPVHLGTVSVLVVTTTVVIVTAVTTTVVTSPSPASTVTGIDSLSRSITISPESRPATVSRSTAAVPSVGWPAKGSSTVGVKIRTP
jgi:hypothetical protein